MRNIHAERLAPLVEMLAGDRGVRCCDHALPEYDSNRALAMCALHPELGLLCERCAGAHGETAHRADRCDYCSFEPDEVHVRPFLVTAAPRVHPPGVRSRDDEDPVVLLAAHLGLYVVVCCTHPRCVERLDGEVAQLGHAGPA